MWISQTDRNDKVSLKLKSHFTRKPLQVTQVQHPQGTEDDKLDVGTQRTAQQQRTTL